MFFFRPARFALLFTSLVFGAIPAAMSQSADRDTLRVGLGGEPATLDPALSGDKTSNFVIIQLYEGLVTLDTNTMAVKPGVASRWAFSKDGKTVTFYLNPKAKWSNGRQVTATDFVKSWRRILDPKTGSSHATHLFPIVGSEELYKASSGTTKSKASVPFGAKALSPTVLQIKLNSPTPHILQMLASKYFLPVPFPEFAAQPKKIEDHPDKMVTNGAYRLKSRVFQKSLTLVPNPNYWDFKNVAIKQVLFKPVADASVEANYFRKNQLDITYTVPAPKAKGLYKKRDPKLSVSPFLAIGYLALNCAKAPLTDPKVREALSLTVDRKALTDKLFATGQYPTKLFVPKGMPAYEQQQSKRTTESSIDYQKDIKKAKALLAEAGFPGGKGFPALEVLYNTNEDVKLMLVAIQSMWRQHLGINVKLLNMEWRVFLQNFKKKNYTIARGAWAGNFADPSAFLNLFRSGNVNNRSNWSDPKYQSLLDKAAVTMDQTQRMADLAAAERIMLDDHVIIPIMQPMRLRMVQPRVKMKTPKGLAAYKPNPLDTVFFKDLALSPKPVATR